MLYGWWIADEAVSREKGKAREGRRQVLMEPSPVRSYLHIQVALVLVFVVGPESLPSPVVDLDSHRKSKSRVPVLSGGFVWGRERDEEVSETGDEWGSPPVLL